jgi:hypothetical protein
MMQLSKKIPFDDPQVLMGVRAMYIISNLLIAASYLWCQWKIDAKKGMDTESSSVKGWTASANRSRYDNA